MEALAKSRHTVRYTVSYDRYISYKMISAALLASWFVVVVVCFLLRRLILLFILFVFSLSYMSLSLSLSLFSFFEAYEYVQ